MTSKKFFFKLMMEDLKDRIWSLALAVFVFFLSMPVYFMLSVNENRIDRSVNATIGNTSVLIPIITVVGAVICAVNGFIYLNNRAKTDHWHSLPVRREVLFLAKYVNGILIYLFAYVVNLAVTLTIFAADGHLTGDVFSNAYTTLLANLSAYLLFYSIALVAVMLTGHTLVTLSGILVFYFYGPCVSMLTYYLKFEFFSTLYETGVADEFFGAPWCSPVNAYVKLVNEPPFMFPLFLAAAAISLLALFLYRKRPSEAAGTAMAFYITRPLFKFVLLVPLALGGGMFFMKVSNEETAPWFLFGMVLAWFAGSVLAEVIFALDFRRALDHKRTSLACLAAAICIFTIFRMDLFGYDTWLPDPDKLDSISISFDSLDRNISTYELNLDPNSSSYDSYTYVNRSSYRLNHMNLTGDDMALAYQFASAGAEYAGNDQAHFYAESDMEVSAPPSLYFDVKYTLKSGREVYRAYHIFMDWSEDQAYLKDSLEQLYISEDYKRGCFPILQPELPDDFYTELVLYNQEYEPENRRLTSEQRVEFMQAFKKDLLNTTLEASATDRVMGSLLFKIDYDDYGRNGEYPVYESYTETIRLLNEYGIYGFTVPDISKLTQVEVVPEVRYSSNVNIYPESVVLEDKDGRYTANGHVFTDPEEMKEILSRVTSMEGNASFYHLYSNEPLYSVYALGKTEYTDLEVFGRYYLMPDDTPEFFKDITFE